MPSHSLCSHASPTTPWLARRQPVHAVEEQPASFEAVGDRFRDVELFLAEHGLEETEESQEAPDFETYKEDEAAEILAATWKGRRAELNMVQESHKFLPADRRGGGGQGKGPGKEFRRSFRVQVEELKQ